MNAELAESATEFLSSNERSMYMHMDDGMWIVLGAKCGYEVLLFEK